jgi:hypothetical protein
MATEEQVKELAYFIWEKEGRPDGKHLEHYSRARQILEEQEALQQNVKGAAKEGDHEQTPGTDQKVGGPHERVRLSVEEHLIAIRRLIEEERKAISTKAASLVKSKASTGA